MYGCKAYALDKHIPKTEKMAPRAHTGYLVGYDGTNIYNIWIHSQHKVIRTRDVIFDEQSFYKKGDVDQAQLETEPFLHETLDIPRIEPSTVIEELDSDTDEDDPVVKPRTPTSSGASTPKPSTPKQPKGKEKETTAYSSPSTIGGETPPYTPFRPDDKDDDSHALTPYPRLPSVSPQYPSLTTYPELPSQTTPDQIQGPSDPLLQRWNDHLTQRWNDTYIPGSYDDEFLDAPEQPTPTPAPTKKARKPRAKQEYPNLILPPGTKRPIKPPPPRGVLYTQALDKAASGALDAFHESFSAFITARSYYEQETPSSKPIQAPNLSSTRIHREQLPPEPQNWKEMLKHPYSAQFIKASGTEVKQLQDKQTWREVAHDHALRADKTPIPLTWVFKYKFDEQGFLLKFKARLCARGDMQQTAADTFAATLAIRIFRALMAIVAAFGLETRQYDAVNAFANSEIDEPTYCRPPQGWTGPKGVLLLLLRALYGLKQSPALWLKHLTSTLTKLGFKQVPGTDCLFLSEHILLFFYVDDICILYEQRHVKTVEEFQAKLFEAYEMRYLGDIEWFLGIRITRDRANKRLCLCQDSYIDKLVNKFNLKSAGRHPTTPLSNVDKLIKNTEQADPQQIYAYQQHTGSINFAATTTRADIAFAASKLSEFMTNPAPAHQEAAERTLRYLDGTKYYCIIFDGNCDPRIIFLGSSDASFADDLETRHSSQGYCFKLFGGLIDWRAGKQKTVTMSSTEAELLAVTDTAKEAMWWDRFFKNVELDVGHKTIIQYDNAQTMRILSSGTSQCTTKLRHVDVHRHWLRQEVKKKTVNVKWTPSADVLADGLIKALPPQHNKQFIELIGLKELKPDDQTRQSNSHSASGSAAPQKTAQATHIQEEDEATGDD